MRGVGFEPTNPFGIGASVLRLWPGWATPAWNKLWKTLDAVANNRNSIVLKSFTSFHGTFISQISHNPAKRKSPMSANKFVKNLTLLFPATYSACSILICLFYSIHWNLLFLKSEGSACHTTHKAVMVLRVRFHEKFLKPSSEVNEFWEPRDALFANP